MNDYKLTSKDCKDIILSKFPDAKLVLWYDKYWIKIDGLVKLGGCDTIADAWTKSYLHITEQ